VTGRQNIVRDLDELFAAIEGLSFQRHFALPESEIAYLRERGLHAVMMSMELIVAFRCWARITWVGYDPKSLAAQVQRRNVSLSCSFFHSSSQFFSHIPFRPCYYSHSALASHEFR